MYVVMSLYDSVVELATTSRAMGLDPSWRLMAMAKKGKNQENFHASLPLILAKPSL